MEKLGLDLDDGSSPSDQKQANPQEGRKLSIQHCMQCLLHVCQCCDANCRLASCQKMKRVVQHMKICKRKTNGGCPICKHLIALFCYHAKHCQEMKCPVPFCLNIKHKLKQQQLQQRLQQAQLLRRRMAVMNTRTTVPSDALPGSSGAGGPGYILAGGSVAQADVRSGQPGAGNIVSLQAPHQHADMQTPPSSTLQVVKQETKCPVPFCLNIKHELKEQQLQQRLQQAQLLRRRMAVMNTRTTVPSGALPGNSGAEGPDGILAGGPVAHADVRSGQPGAGNMVSLQAPHQPADMQTPPSSALQVVKQETKCPVPFCLNIKHELKEQQLQQRLQQAQLLRRRMAVMNTRTTVPSGALPGNSGAEGPDGILAGGPVAHADVRSGQPGAGNMVSLQAPHQPADMQTPPSSALQVVKQVQEEAARQQTPHYPGEVTSIGVIGGQPQVMPPPQMQRLPIGPIGPTNTHLIPTIDQLRYVSNATLQNSGLRQTAPQAIQQQQPQPHQQHLQQPQQNMLTGSHISNPIPPIIHPPTTTGAGMPRPGFQKETLQQLLQTLRSPNTPEQQQQILHILKSNPQLMAAFIKQRQVYQHQQQQAAQQQGQAGAGHQQQLQHMMSPQQYLQQPQQNMLTGSHISDPIPPIIHPPTTTGAGMPRPGFQKETLQQLLQTLRSPNTPEQQQQILHILKSNPQLMAAFIKQRQVYQHQQQQAAQQQGQAGAGHQQQLQHMMSPQQQLQQQQQGCMQMQAMLSQQQQEGSVLPQQGQQ